MAQLNPPIRDWTDQVVWIVGASSGIGEALAAQLTRQGARVIASARRQQVLDDMTPAPARTIALDVADPDAIDRAITIMRNERLVPDVVFWVAGVYHPMTSQALDLKGVRETFEVNLIAAYKGLAAMLELWKSSPSQPRHWSWVSSVAGYRGLPQAAAYGASKAALTYLAETNYMELKREGIAISVVCPGFVQTRLAEVNDFKMPAMISPDQAATLTLQGLARGEFEIHYPKRFTRWLKLLRLLPYWIYFALVSKTVKSPHGH
jgi:NAD(P)-dependent dehydrogenase (short-subunit alcohol dehydrogenase family)